MPEREQTGETRADDTSHASITFAEFTLDHNGEKISMCEALQAQHREYTEIPHRPGEIMQGFLREGSRELVGAYKTAILRICAEWMSEHRTDPLPFDRVLDACVQAAPKIDLTHAHNIPYVPHPKYGDSDKERLPYRPDFVAIDRLRDFEDELPWHAHRAFFESLYAIQKYAAGIRDDIFGGSILVPEQPSWENRYQEFEVQVPEAPQDELPGVSEQLGEIALRTTGSFQE